MGTIYYLPTLFQEWNANYPYLLFCRIAVKRTAIIKLTNDLDLVGNSEVQLASIADRKVALKGTKESVGLRRAVLIKNQLIDMDNMHQVLKDEITQTREVKNPIWQLGSCFGLRNKL
ncbi:hypothetical protein [Sodalis praecaptivus]|uniref:hypothetical protein n=1 Tax=Sodalis TaxID=84565 RepID=UPI00046CD2EA|nr:hypothetical protein [Sodalis praecaptivus]